MSDERGPQDRFCVVCNFPFKAEGNERFCSMLCLRWYKEEMAKVSAQLAPSTARPQ